MLISIEGLPKAGKSFFSHTFPNPLHIDFAYILMDFRNITTTDNETGDAEVAVSRFYSEPSEMHRHYVLVHSFGQLRDIILSGGTKSYSTIIIDDTYKMRAWKVMELIASKNIDWPGEGHWGQITQDIVRTIGQCRKSCPFVVVVHQMKKEKTEDGKSVYVPNYIPKNVLHIADIALRVEAFRGKRVVRVVENRFLDKAGADWVTEVSNPDFVTVMAELQVPEKLWIEHI